MSFSVNLDLPQCVKYCTEYLTFEGKHFHTTLANLCSLLDKKKTETISVRLEDCDVYLSW